MMPRISNRYIIYTILSLLEKIDIEFISGTFESIYSKKKLSKKITFLLQKISNSIKLSIVLKVLS